METTQIKHENTKQEEIKKPVAQPKSEKPAEQSAKNKKEQPPKLQTSDNKIDNSQQISPQNSQPNFSQPSPDKKYTNPQTPQTPDTNKPAQAATTGKKTKESKSKKEEAFAKGMNLRASKKHCMYICSFIKNKSIDKAIQELQLVIQRKKAVPFKGEIPHRKGMMSGRYPVNASKQFINLLKALKGNAIVNGLDIDKTIISTASANWASRPQRPNFRRAKRTNVILKAREIQGGKKVK